MTTDRDTVHAWMLGPPERGYKAAASHFGLELELVKSWGRPRPAPRARAREAAVEPPPAQVHESKAKRQPPHELRGEDQIVAKIEEIRAERRRWSKLPNTATAVHGTHKLEAELLKELRELQRPASEDKPAEMTTDEAIEALVALVPVAPDSAIDLLEQAIAARRQGRPLLREVR